MARLFTVLALAALTVTAAACQRETQQTESQPQTPAADTSAAASHEGHAARRVFFVEPKNGATIGTNAKFVFGSEQFAIAAVPAGEITQEQVRADTGHFHLGVDTDCMAAGQIIPKADPWIHFGSGTNTIEMQLAPGPHKFAVQAGDDQHRTLEGLCETLSVTVQ